VTFARKAYGARGEAAARQYLEDQGSAFVAANYQTRFGEIDLIMRDGETLVFVEVKARQRATQGAPQEAVTARKLKRLLHAAETYMRETLYGGAWRVDVVAITAADIVHLENVTI